jgi:hypothetical protein
MQMMMDAMMLMHISCCIRSSAACIWHPSAVHPSQPALSLVSATGFHLRSFQVRLTAPDVTIDCVVGLMMDSDAAMAAASPQSMACAGLWMDGHHWHRMVSRDTFIAY